MIARPAICDESVAKLPLQVLVLAGYGAKSRLELGICNANSAIADRRDPITHRAPVAPGTKFPSSQVIVSRWARFWLVSFINERF